ncbi:MAG: hypothetical protein RQ899_07795 [Pseudomonadales bacterium]|nr:hypothetical protein [Pseudomonadales bacterium]
MSQQSSRESVVPELRRLLDVVFENGTRHLFEVESDLDMTTLLLNDAIEKLGQRFNALNQAVRDQQDKIDVLLSQHDIKGSAVEDIRQLSALVNTEVNAAVSSMQFHDLTSQLIGWTVSRVNGLRELLSILANPDDGIVSNQEHPEITGLLQEISDSLKARSLALDAGLRRSVDRQHLNCGDIELF